MQLQSEINHRAQRVLYLIIQATDWQLIRVPECEANFRPINSAASQPASQQI